MCLPENIDFPGFLAARGDNVTQLWPMDIIFFLTKKGGGRAVIFLVCVFCFFPSYSLESLQYGAWGRAANLQLRKATC